MKHSGYRNFNICWRNLRITLKIPNRASLLSDKWSPDVGRSRNSSCKNWATAIISGLCRDTRDEHLTDVRLLAMSSYLVDYPFAERLYDRSLDVLKRLAPGDKP